MSKYSGMLQWDLEVKVLQSLHPRLTEHQIENAILRFKPTQEWASCYQVLDALLATTTGINLKSDGTATTEINGKQESAGGGHCRAICELYLMMNDEEINHD